MKHKKIIAALCGVLSILGISMSTSPAFASGTVKASNYGNKISYDSDYTNGYSWSTFSKGTSKSWKANAAFKTSGKSIALVTGLNGVVCKNTAGPIRIGDPKGQTVTIQGYPKADCKN